MKKLLLLLVICAALYSALTRTDFLHRFRNSSAPILTQSDSSDQLRAAFAGHLSGLQVTGDGVVSKLLPDDTQGNRHQRFILTLPSGQTLLVAHNIDIASRIDSLRTGDSVAFNGVYEWNDKGGVVHWTHHDPGGRHQAGWLRHAGRTYQ